HSPATALYTYQDELHVFTLSNDELIKILANQSVNPDYDYIKNLFTCYCNSQLGKRNE
ncbi:8061_t:CDS:1, partial [Dentiscutata erythropus]